MIIAGVIFMVAVALAPELGVRSLPILLASAIPAFAAGAIWIWQIFDAARG